MSKSTKLTNDLTTRLLAAHDKIEELKQLLVRQASELAQAEASLFNLHEELKTVCRGYEADIAGMRQEFNRLRSKDSEPAADGFVSNVTFK